MTRHSHHHAHHHAHEQVTSAHHTAHLSHEIIAAAAAYEAAKAWSEHQEKHGKHTSHAKAKEFMAAASAAFITHMIETRGLDAFDQHKIRTEAAKHHDNHLKDYY